MPRLSQSFFANANTLPAVERLSDRIYDDLSFIWRQWREILADTTITATRREEVIGRTLRLSVMMELCQTLGKHVDTLEEASHAVTPWAEATEIYKLSCRYLEGSQY